MSAMQLGIFGDADACEPQDRDRWCTPPHVIELVREALGGGIDLDPASNARAQEVVKADRWHSLDKGEDGLALPWRGRVWCNPPYSKGAIELFSNKIVSEWRGGQVVSAIMLTNSSTSAGWWQQLAREADALVFCSQRLSFWHAETRATQKGNFYDQTIFVFSRLVNLRPLEQLGAVISKDHARRVSVKPTAPATREQVVAPLTPVRPVDTAASTHTARLLWATMQKPKR